MIYVYLCAGIFESRQNYLCVLMSVPLYCPVVMVRAETIFSIVTEAFCSLSPLCHTLDVIVRGGLQHFASCTCKHDIRNEREREVS